LFIRAAIERELGRPNSAGLNLPVKSLSSVFHTALARDDNFSMQADFVRLGRSSFDVLVRATRSSDRAPAFEVRLTLVSIMNNPRRALPLPQEVRGAIQKLVSTPPEKSGHLSLCVDHLVTCNTSNSSMMDRKERAG
jgi:acyl-CoA thioesterase FadM